MASSGGPAPPQFLFPWNKEALKSSRPNPVRLPPSPAPAPGLERSSVQNKEHLVFRRDSLACDAPPRGLRLLIMTRFQGRKFPPSGQQVGGQPGLHGPQ